MRGGEAVHRQDAQRRRSVNHNVVVVVQERFELALKNSLGCQGLLQLNLGAGEVDVRWG